MYISQELHLYFAGRYFYRTDIRNINRPDILYEPQEHKAIFSEEDYMEKNHFEIIRNCEQILMLSKNFFAINGNWKDLPKITSYQTYFNITDKANLNNIKKNPVNFLVLYQGN